MRVSTFFKIVAPPAPPAKHAPLPGLLPGCAGSGPFSTPPPAPTSTTDPPSTTPIEPTTTTDAIDTPANPGNSMDCSDFATYAEAEAWFDTYFPVYGDVARLDNDDNGQPCESLPGGPGVAGPVPQAPAAVRALSVSTRDRWAR